MTEVQKAAYLSMEVSRVNTTYIFIALGFIAVAVMFFLFRLPEAKDTSNTVLSLNSDKY